VGPPREDSSITIGRAPDLFTMSGKRGPSSGTMVSPRKSFFQSLDKDERDALLKIAPSLRCATTEARTLNPPFPPE